MSQRCRVLFLCGLPQTLRSSWRHGKLFRQCAVYEKLSPSRIIQEHLKENIIALLLLLLLLLIIYQLCIANNLITVHVVWFGWRSSPGFSFLSTESQSSSSFLISGVKFTARCPINEDHSVTMIKLNAQGTARNRNKSLWGQKIFHLKWLLCSSPSSSLHQPTFFLAFKKT